MRLCPACERIKGHDAAGVLIIEAPVFTHHEAQIQATMAHLVRSETESHPMERILGIEKLPDGSCLVETTGVHLLRRLGHGLARAFSAHLHTHYLEAQIKGVMRLSLQAR